MDICIFKIVYPNDPTVNSTVHQHFIGYMDQNLIVFYSISSILKKEYKVFPNGKANPSYYIIDGNEYLKCGLRVPSFIDCTKSYSLKLNGSFDILKLSNRTIPPEIKNKILEKIENEKIKGTHKNYIIKTKDFIKLNYKCKTNVKYVK